MLPGNLSFGPSSPTTTPATLSVSTTVLVVNADGTGRDPLSGASRYYRVTNCGSDPVYLQRVAAGAAATAASTNFTQSPLYQGDWDDFFVATGEELQIVRPTGAAANVTVGRIG